MIRGVSDKPLWFDGVGNYYLEDRKSDIQYDDYVNRIEFQIWDWKLVGDIPLPIFSVAMVMLSTHYHKSFLLYYYHVMWLFDIF